MKRTALFAFIQIILACTFSFASFAAVTVLFGDINSDKAVNISDSVKLAQYLAEWNVNLSDDEKDAADVYPDKKIDAKDSVMLSQYLANWDVTLGEKPKGEYENVVFAVDNGIVMNSESAAATNTSKLNSLISKAAKDTAIVFPEGTCYITTQITIQGKTRLALRGENTKLIDVKYDPKQTGIFSRNNSLVFGIQNSSDILIEGFTIDYKAHTSADGVIQKKENGKTYIRVFEEYVSGGKTPLSGGEQAFAAEFFDSYNIIQTDEVYFDGLKTLEKIDDNTFAVPVSMGSVGQKVTVRFSSGSYASPMFYVLTTSSLKIKDVTVNSCPSAVFYIPAGSENFTFENFSVKPADGSNALFGSNEDSIHIKGMRGKLILRNCNFIGLGDDALNVHSLFLKANSISGNVITLAAAGQYQGIDSSWAKVGDTVQFYNPSNCKDYGTAVITAFSGSKLTLDAIPSGVTTGTFLQNLAHTPVVTISGCSFERSRARGILLQTKEATVENCTFKNIRLSAILIAPDFDQWCEAGFSDNITIKNNTFEKCMLCSWFNGKGVIMVNECHDFNSYLGSGFYNHKLITVTGNTFKDSPTAYGLYAHGVNKVNFVSNTVTGCKGEKSLIGCGS